MNHVILRLESVIELAFFIISGAGRAVKLKPERRVLADIRPKEFREIAVRMPDPLEVEALIFDRTQREDRGGTPVSGHAGYNSAPVHWCTYSLMVPRASGFWETF